MKRIALFADGTWNSPKRAVATNVLRLSRAIKPETDTAKQIAFYDWGVGTDRKTISGGISGAGIDKNIMDCYRFLVHNYETGDQLYLFGFSRGAYTVRSLAGFIRNCGLLKREHAARIPDAYQLYRKRSRASGPNATVAIRFREAYAVADITPIELVGVWDTVGALGIPIPFWGALGEQEFLFHDTEPSKIIRHARHAVAIDEDREDFSPTLWDEKPGLDLKQVWFAGVHSDIGGGYREQGLSDCSLQWLIQQAEQLGLRFEQHLYDSLKAEPTARQHNERKGIYKARRLTVRAIKGPIHDSVRQRWDADAFGYRAKSKALQQLLDKHQGDWDKVDIEH